MKILFVASEVAPFVSVGGLSQFMYFLPQALKQLGHDVRIFTAKYGAMDQTAPRNGWKLQTVYSQLAVPVDDNHDAESKSLICNVKLYDNDHNRILTYFLENREYYELRANVYSYKDDYIRFALLSKGCLEWLYQSNNPKNRQSSSPDGDWWPEIIHCNDWLTAYMIDFARRCPRYIDTFKQIPFVLTVHNFGAQGNYDFRYAAQEDFDSGRSKLAPLLSPKLQKQNSLKRGLLLADAVNTVSLTHAVEVLTPEYSEGLDSVLREVKNKVTGILNGLDTKEFNPATDKTIKKQFTIHSFVRAREENKKALQKLFSLPVDAKHPVLAFIGRLAKQKGLDILLDILPHLLSQRPDVQIVLLGTGDDRYRLELSVLQKNYPDQIGLHLRSNFLLPRKIFAGADMICIPSLFEPGGIVALEALRYGCVPIVRRTGGLNDIITDFSPDTKAGNGFSFKNSDKWAFYAAVIEALTIYKYRRLWRTLVKNCLASDFSWNHAANEYNDWYKKVIKEKAR